MRRRIYWLKFIPERGRKPVVACIPRLADWLKFIPERGRKLVVLCLLQAVDELKFIPERGRKQSFPTFTPKPFS